MSARQRDGAVDGTAGLWAVLPAGRAQHAGHQPDYVAGIRLGQLTQGVVTQLFKPLDDGGAHPFHPSSKLRSLAENCFTSVIAEPPFRWLLVEHQALKGPD